MQRDSYTHPNARAHRCVPDKWTMARARAMRPVDLQLKLNHSFSQSTGPTVSPTISPTAAPTPVLPGMCTQPYTVTLGDNAFNNAPPNGVNLDTTGTPCNFAATGYSVRE